MTIFPSSLASGKIQQTPLKKSDYYMTRISKQPLNNRLLKIFKRTLSLSYRKESVEDSI